jgi:hypothetical protein
MQTKIKVKAGKRTIFINKKKYFLEFPELIFTINYEDRIVKCKKYSGKKYSVKLSINKKLPLGNIGGYNGKWDVCLGKQYFDKENFPNNVIERFFCSRFVSAGLAKTVKFYERWQQYGFDHIKNEI